MKIAVTSALVWLGALGTAAAQQPIGMESWWTRATAITTGLASSGGSHTPAEVYATFGLVGTWANDCAQPASGRNWRVTYRPIEDGSIANDTDYGGATPARAIVRSASIDSEGRLHITGFSTFEDLPPQYQTRFGKDGARPGARFETVLARTPEGGIRFMESAVTAEGRPTEKTVTGGLTINPQTGLPGPPPLARVACNPPVEATPGTRVGVGQR